MRKLLYISLLILAACETPLTLQPSTPVGNGNVGSYFWPDTVTTYKYTSPQGTHQITLSDTTIFDLFQSTTTRLTVLHSNGTYALEGFSPSDIFGLDPWLQVVSDTNAPKAFTEQIKSIGTLGYNQQTMRVFALSNSSALYVVDQNSLQLSLLGNLPAGFTLAEDLEGNNIFAYQQGGDSLMWSKDGVLWGVINTFALNSSPITAFCSGAVFTNSDFCWFACGNQIYRIDGTTGNVSAPVGTLPSTVVSIAPEGSGEIFAATRDGNIYEVKSNSGTFHLRGTVPGTLNTIACGWSFSSIPVFAATSAGLYTVSSSGTVSALSSGNISSVYFSGNSIFASRSDSVLHYSSNGSQQNGYINPASGSVFQYAHGNSSVPGLFSLSGSTFYRLNNYSGPNSSWSPANQTIQPQWNPAEGALTLLNGNDTGWNAGFIASSQNGGGPQPTLPKFYSYHASAQPPYSSIKLDGTNYNNVLEVDYTPSSNIGDQHGAPPSFLIYYQQGIGPIRIERTENNGSKTVTMKQ